MRLFIPLVHLTNLYDLDWKMHESRGDRSSPMVGLLGCHGKALADATPVPSQLGIMVHSSYSESAVQH